MANNGWKTTVYKIVEKVKWNIGNSTIRRKRHYLHISPELLNQRCTDPSVCLEVERISVH